MAALWDTLRGFRPQDAIDILLLAAVIYWLLLRIQGTRSIPILLGLSILLAVYALVAWLKLEATTFLMQHLFSSAVVVLVVLFQADIRNVLARLGLTTMFHELSDAARQDLIDEVVEAASRLVKRRIGATIVLENGTGLRNFIERGVAVQAPPTVALLEAIFHVSSPLHDGAVIITNQGQLAAARCILPLTASHGGKAFLGTRHRSALGLTEETDALAIVVSQERRQISLAYDGVLYMGLDADSLRRGIVAILQDGEEPDATLESAATRKVVPA